MPEPVIVVGSPIAPELSPETVLPVPMLIAFLPVAFAPLPIAIAAPLAAEPATD